MDVRRASGPAGGPAWRAARLAAALSALWMAPADAGGLLDAWQAAQQHDPELSAARAAQQAGDARRRQADALWRPSVQLTGTAGAVNASTATTGARFSAPGFGQSDGVAFATSVNGGTTLRWQLAARQPLVSGERRAQSRQLELSAGVADLAWQDAQQALVLRVAERYLDVALAAESLRVLRRQQAAVEQALGEVRERFRLGDVPVTGTYEAGARAEAIRAQVLAAETELAVKQAALSDLTGLPAQDVPPLRVAAQGNAVATTGQLRELADWLAEAAARNPQLRMQLARVDIARQEAARTEAAAQASLDLVAMASRDRIGGSGDFGRAGNTIDNQVIGLQLSVPLYSGGLRSARREEALSLAEQARAQAEHARQQVALQTRTVWLGLSAGAARVAALAETLKASRARLDATRLGHQVGDRTTLELLGAENDAASAEVALLQARVGLLLDRLRLAALAGGLDEAQLRAVDAMLLAADDG